jgi:hypothetical protein
VGERVLLFSWPTRLVDKDNGAEVRDGGVDDAGSVERTVAWDGRRDRGRSPIGK